MHCVALCLLIFLQISVICAVEISVPNGGSRGGWGMMDVCPEGTRATGFKLKVENKKGKLVDDTALNAISLYCTENGSRSVLKEITSTVGPFGWWKDSFYCSSGFLESFCLRVENTRRDNTAANNIKFRCSNSEILEGDGQDWGSYGSWSEKCPDGICGIKTRVEGKRGFLRDDTALNDASLLCCST